MGASAQKYLHKIRKKFQEPFVYHRIRRELIWSKVMNSIKTLSTTMADVPHSTKRKRTRKDINVSGINTSHHGSNSQMKWTIDATVGGKFGRRTIFSKDEKYYRCLTITDLGTFSRRPKDQ